MRSEEEIRAEIERVNKILKDKADRSDKSDWDYYTFSQKDVSLLCIVQNYLGFGKITEPVAGPRLTCRGEESRGLAVELLRYSCIERKRDMLRRRFGLDN